MSRSTCGALVADVDDDGRLAPRCEGAQDRVLRHEHRRRPVLLEHQLLRTWTRHQNYSPHGAGPKPDAHKPADPCPETTKIQLILGQMVQSSSALDLGQHDKRRHTSSVRSRASLGLNVGSASIIGCSSVFTRNRSLQPSARSCTLGVGLHQGECKFGGRGCGPQYHLKTAWADLKR